MFCFWHSGAGVITRNSAKGFTQVVHYVTGNKAFFSAGTEALLAVDPEVSR